MEVNDLLAAAETIKNENSINKNSSNRIGVMLENMINFFSTTISPAAAALIQDAVSKSTTGVRKGMSVVWSGAIAEIPVGYVLSNGNNGQPINGVVVPDYRSRFLIGYDSSKASFPINVSDTTENYGKAGNTGGEATHKLTVSEIPAHKHRILGNAGNDQSNTQGREMGINGPDYGNITENAGGDQSHENRPPYYVVYWITKVSDDTTAEYNSAYQSYKTTTTDNPIKTEAEWVVSLNGNGISAFEIAMNNGFAGTQAEWLSSLHGMPGNNAPATMAIFQIGANGTVLPRKLPSYSYDRTISDVRLSSDCLGLYATIGVTNYDHITLIGVTIPRNIELKINNLTIKAGSDSADALIIF